MGLAASQARLLSITARLSDNELHSQQISNSKVRLADKTQEASEEYINALNATKLTYKTYDASGNATEVALTPAVMYQYGDLKNQYGISNSSGQLLISSTDAANFQASNDIDEFLQLYGVQLVSNQQFFNSLQSIYGANYSNFYDVNTDSSLVNWSGFNISNWSSSVDQSMTEQQYQTWMNQISGITLTGYESGLYGNLISELFSNAPAYPGEEPQAPAAVEMPDFANLANAYNDSQCYDAVSASALGIGHMEHNLAALIWSTDAFGTDNNGQITNSDGTITIINHDDGYNTGWGFSLTNFNFIDEDGTGKNLIDALKSEDIADYACVQELVQNLIDLYCDVINYLVENNCIHPTVSTQLEPDSYTLQSTAEAKTAEELFADWEQFYADLAGLTEKGEAEYQEKMQQQQEQYQHDYAVWSDAWLDVYSWLNNCNALYNDYIASLTNLPTRLIPDEDDSKTSWYTNLWHRINGESDRKSADGIAGKYYKQLDDNLLTSQAWLQFALEHGIVTMEQVQFVDESEDGTGLKNTRWTSIIYSSCTDISTTEDEVAIAAAEAEYNKKLNELEAKDKKYDNDIKKLDTEHNALQTEYESVKSVIEKNTERSFKAFS